MTLACRLIDPSQQGRTHVAQSRPIKRTRIDRRLSSTVVDSVRETELPACRRLGRWSVKKRPAHDWTCVVRAFVPLLHFHFVRPPPAAAIHTAHITLNHDRVASISISIESHLPSHPLLSDRPNRRRRQHATRRSRALPTASFGHPQQAAAAAADARASPHADLTKAITPNRCTLGWRTGETGRRSGRCS